MLCATFWHCTFNQWRAEPKLPRYSHSRSPCHGKTRGALLFLTGLENRWCATLGNNRVLVLKCMKNRAWAWTSTWTAIVSTHRWSQIIHPMLTSRHGCHGSAWVPMDSHSTSPKHECSACEANFEERCHFFKLEESKTTQKGCNLLKQLAQLADVYLAGSSFLSINGCFSGHQLLSQRLAGEEAQLREEVERYPMGRTMQPDLICQKLM